MAEASAAALEVEAHEEGRAEEEEERAEARARAQKLPPPCARAWNATARCLTSLLRTGCEESDNDYGSVDFRDEEVSATRARMDALHLDRMDTRIHVPLVRLDHHDPTNSDLTRRHFGSAVGGNVAHAKLAMDASLARVLPHMVEQEEDGDSSNGKEAGGERLPSQCFGGAAVQLGKWWCARVRWRISHFFSWMLALLVGVATAPMIYLSLGGTRLLWRTRDLALNAARDSGTVAGFGIDAGLSILLAVAATLVTLLAPGSAGSGIPTILGYLNGVRGPTVWQAIRLRAFLGTWIGVTLSAASGGFFGNEGPLIHAAAAFAALTRSMLTRFRGFNTRRYRNEVMNTRSVSFGAACAISALFQAPIAGTFLVVEEIAGSAIPPYVIQQVLFATVCTFYVIDFIRRSFVFGKGVYATPVAFQETCHYRAAEVPAMLIVGCACGLLGAVYTHASLVVVKAMKWARARVANARGPAVGGAWAVAVVAVAIFVCRMVAVYLPLAGWTGCTPATASHMLTNHAGLRSNPTSTEVWSELRAGSHGLCCLPTALENLFVASVDNFKAPTNFTILARSGGIQRDTEFVGNVRVLRQAYFKEDAVEQGLTLMGPSGVLPYSLRRLNCPPGHYSALHSLLGTYIDDAVRSVLVRGVPYLYDWPSLLLAAMFYMILSPVMQGLELPQGTLLPTLFIGGCIGRAIGLGLRMTPEASKFGSSPVADPWSAPSLAWDTSPDVIAPPWALADPGFFAIIGAAAFLGSVCRIPLTTSVLMTELVNASYLFPPIALTSFLACFVSGWFDGASGGIYHLMVHKVLHMPYLDPDPIASQWAAHTAVRDVMATPVVTVPEWATAAQIASILREAALRGLDCNGFPVVASDGQLVGLVNKGELFLIFPSLEKGNETKEGDEDDEEDEDEEEEEEEDAKDAAKDIRSRVLHRPVFTVEPHWTCLAARLLIQRIGIRHLVVAAGGRPVGMLTRKDIAEPPANKTR